ncbi:putative DD41D transposase [Trichonephila clavipes]|nr:putative DD41D transposase [Trichonephila clavipes]
MVLKSKANDRRTSCHAEFLNFRVNLPPLAETRLAGLAVQHTSYEVQFQRTLLYHPLAVGEDSLPDSKLLLAKNCGGISDFRLNLYKWSDDSHLRDGQQFLHLTGVYQPQRSRCFLPGWDCVQLFFDQNHVCDEAHFWLNGYVNKQNCRIWSEANPQVYIETPLHPEKLTVWCALWAGGIIGPYFFKNDEGHNVTVNGDRYRAMITNFFIPELNNHGVQELWFQQDSATCHTARATIDLLKDTFGDRLISRFGPVNWPPRSCDLTPLDYFLWGYVKSLVYADKPQTLDHLEDNIRRVIADIRPQMLEKVIENWTSRLDYIRASRGSPMP